MSTNSKDKKVQELFDVVQKKKAEIAKAEKPNWETNCSFGFGSTNTRLNLHTVVDATKLIEAYAFLLEKKERQEEAAKGLGLDFTFEWMGYSINQWKADFKTRATKINLGNEKRKLDTLEARLNGLVSKEMKEALELAEIEKLLGDN